MGGVVSSKILQFHGQHRLTGRDLWETGWRHTDRGWIWRQEGGGGGGATQIRWIGRQRGGGDRESGQGDRKGEQGDGGGGWGGE